MYKVDSARLFRDAAKSQRNAEGAATGILAGLTVISASVAMDGDYQGGPVAVFLVMMILWLSSARRFQRAVTSLAAAEARLVKEQDKFDSQIERKLEW